MQSFNTNTSTHATLFQTIFPMKDVNQVLRGTVLVVVGTLVLAISARTQIPFFPVPLTMTTFVILAMSMAYGWKLAGATVLLYLIEGASGLPVFAGTPEKGIGIAYMLGGTGGYLIGYLMAAVTVGWLAERGWDRNVVSTVGAMLIGNALIYIPGLLWLGVLFGWDKPILDWGFTPFVIGDLTKLALAAAILPLTWKIIGKNKRG